MRKKYIYIGAIVCILLILAATFLLFKEKETDKETARITEDKELIKKDGITILGAINRPKYQKMEMEYYYTDSYCKDNLKYAIKEFKNIKLEKSKDINTLNEKGLSKLKNLGKQIEFPLLLFNGIADIYDNNDSYTKTEASFTTLVSGKATCSIEILTANLCRYLKETPALCVNYTFSEKILTNTTIAISIDKVCYECCNIEYMEEGKIINQYLCGQPCNRVDWYIEGKSEAVSKKCFGEDSCKDDKNDKGCCNNRDCVDNNKCYPELIAHDADSNGQIELCINLNNISSWVNPDQSNYSCSYADFYWLNCSSHECIFGIDNYNGKKDGLCCGDDSGEFPTMCNGAICENKEDVACCAEDQCVYNNKCYSPGCVEIELDSGIKTLYCEGSTNKWIDLDNGYCDICLGEKASGKICCGDDIGEGKYYYNKFTFHNNFTKNLDYDGCINKKTDCIHPNNNKPFDIGCYSFDRDEPYLRGGYYCYDNEWYSLNYYPEYCKNCGFDWIKDNEPDKGACCGDEENEYFIVGDDNTSACCNSKTHCVSGGKCSICESCGNNQINDKEECEPQNSFNNKYCNQTETKCFNKKTGRRDKYGNCTSGCECGYDQFDYSCIKSYCYAECNEDGSGCDEGYYCDTSNCVCNPILKRHEEVTKINFSCPYIASIELDRYNYYKNDVITTIVRVYNKENQLIPNARFYLDTFMNDKFITSLIHSTDSRGIYSDEKIVGTFTEPALYKHIIRTNVLGCNIIGDSTKANIIINKTRKSTVSSTSAYSTKVNKPTKPAYLNQITSDFKSPYEIGVCGDNRIGIGEVCEGEGICRASVGCDYKNQRYDTGEYCKNCDCPEDKWSDSDDGDYCGICNHCGDNVVNCGEDCESPDKKYDEVVCHLSKLYKREYKCINCGWNYNNMSETLLDDCYCECPKGSYNCSDGNWIDYSKSYYASCSNDECNECICEDTYTKDSNNDGIDDKCSDELCGNRIDDNDNGIIDEKECVWHYCSQCGHGLSSLCDKEECSNLEEGCFFEEAIFGYGFCSECSLLSTCEDYGYNKINCVEDSCNLSSCFWNNFTCCTDTDGDKICDYNDNCPEIFNPLQEDIDNDSRGDKCEFCDKEPHLFYPQGHNESICNDIIDNDCDYTIDCADNDCFVLCANISQGVFNESK